MRVTGDWLQHPGSQGLCAALEAAGYRALFVGGCVRNDLMGLPVADLDLATDARPEVVTELAEGAGFRVVPTGLDHGTLTVIAGHRPHEVTTFRRDVETFGRHATVAFSTDLAEDAARRDFTMNALYADARGEVFDPLGGLDDLRAGRVRFVGEAAARIREDYLRILRFFRFTAHYADSAQGIDAEGLAACAYLAEGMEGLSRERLGHEMRKLLAARDPGPAVAAMAASGVLGRVLPGADARALPVLVHLEGGAPPDWRGRLAVLGGANVAERLKLSRSEARDLGLLREAMGSMDSSAALGFRLKALGVSAVPARAAVLEQPLAPDWRAEVERGAAATFPVRAADLPDLTGPALGARLKKLQADWLAGGLRADRQTLLQGRGGSLV